MKKIYKILFLIICSNVQSNAQYNAELFDSLRIYCFKDKDSVEIPIILENKNTFYFKYPEPSIDLQKILALVNQIELFQGDSILIELDKIISDINEENRLLFNAIKMDKSNSWNKLFKFSDQKSALIEILKLTRLIVNQNQNKYSEDEEYNQLKFFFLNNQQPSSGRELEILKKRRKKYEKSMLKDFEKINSSKKFNVFKEEAYYHISLPNYLLDSEGSRFEEICEKAYDNGFIKGEFEPGKFFMYMHLGRRGTKRSIDLFFKDIFRDNNINFEFLSEVNTTDYGKKRLDGVICKELRKRRNTSSQMQLLKSYLKGADHIKVKKIKTSCVKYLNPEAKEYINNYLDTY